MASMLAPETLNFTQRNHTEKKAKLSNLKNCSNNKGCFSFHPNDHHEPVVVQNMKIVFSTPSKQFGTANQLQLCLTNDTEYYQVKKVPSIASLVFSRDFLKTFVLQGKNLIVYVCKEVHRW